MQQARRKQQRMYAQCPVCGTSVSVRWVQSHVNACLDSREASPSACCSLQGLSVPSQRSCHGAAASYVSEAEPLQSEEVSAVGCPQRTLFVSGEAEPCQQEEVHETSSEQRESVSFQAVELRELGGNSHRIDGVSLNDSGSEGEENMADIASVLEFGTAAGQRGSDEQGHGSFSDEVARARVAETDAGALPPAPIDFLQPDDSFVQPKLWRFATRPSPAAAAAAGAAPRESPRAKTIVLQNG